MVVLGTAGLIVGTSTASVPRIEARPEQECELQMAFSVRVPGPSDALSLASLWGEMQCHYGQPVDEATAAAAAEFACRGVPSTGFDPRILVAVAAAGGVIGALALNVTFPATELSRSLYVRDLYVARAARRHGVASSLLRAAAALTVTEGFSALDWTADARNADALDLYEGAGAARLGRVYFRLAGPDLLAAAFAHGEAKARFPLD
jgi:GNAT superfamily N-acetyltransferase